MTKSNNKTRASLRRAKSRYLQKNTAIKQFKGVVKKLPEHIVDGGLSDEQLQEIERGMRVLKKAIRLKKLTDKQIEKGAK